MILFQMSLSLNTTDTSLDENSVNTVDRLREFHQIVSGNNQRHS